MSIRKSIKAVLAHMDADHLIISCYDEFPKLYATFKPPKLSQKVLVALLLDYAEETNQLKKLAKRLGLPGELEEQSSKKRGCEIYYRTAAGAFGISVFLGLLLYICQSNQLIQQLTPTSIAINLTPTSTSTPTVTPPPTPIVTPPPTPTPIPTVTPTLTPTSFFSRFVTINNFLELCFFPFVIFLVIILVISFIESRKSSAKLVVTKGPEQGKEYRIPIAVRIIRVGRNKRYLGFNLTENFRININDSSMSREQFIISQLSTHSGQSPRFLILSKTYSDYDQTILNGERLWSHESYYPLNFGDIIQAGKTTFSFEQIEPKP